MAQGDLIIFNEFTLNIGQEQHNFPTDTLKLGLVDSTITPVVGQTSPSWSDFSANEVSTGGGYPAGGITLAGVTYAESAGESTLDANNIALAKDVGGFTDAFWAILYNASNINEAAICFIDMDGPVSEQAGPIIFTWAGTGITVVRRV